MIPSLAIQIGTVATFFVGFAVGWWWRGRRGRELALSLLAEVQKKQK